MRKLSLLLACIGLAGQLPAIADDHSSTVERQTRFGPIVGSDDSAINGTYAWKGVPFAKAPVGELRWKAPVDPEGWKKPRKTQQFGNACVQYGRIYGPGANNRYDATIGTTLNQAVGSEDCLYLNIWAPADRGHGHSRDDRDRGRRDDHGGHNDDAAGGLPVIVFVHGGSNVSGYTADPVYDGAALARAAHAVVVTVNYRLGIFGFLNLAQLKSGTHAQQDSGNFALLDIIKALKFVRHDIAKFGGNPSNVTLMGQSAGAINVYALLTTPATVDARPRLFHRAAPLSGGISLSSNLPPGRLPTLNPASFYATQGNQLLYQQVVADKLAPDLTSAAAWVASQPAATVAAYMRSQTPQALLLTLLTKLAPLGLAGSGPIPDGAMLPLDPIGAMASGNYLRVPVLAGNTRDEGKLFPTFLALFGGPSGRLVTDKQLFDIQLAYQPDAPAQITIDQWIPAAYLPVTTPGHRIQRQDGTAEPALPDRRRRERAEYAEVAAERGLVLPLRLGSGARAVQRHLRRSACVRSGIPLQQLRAIAVLEHREFNSQSSGSAGAFASDDVRVGSLCATRRSQRAGCAGSHLANMALQAGVRCHADGQDHLRAVDSIRATQLAEPRNTKQ